LFIEGGHDTPIPFPVEDFKSIVRMLDNTNETKGGIGLLVEGLDFGADLSLTHGPEELEDESVPAAFTDFFLDTGSVQNGKSSAIGLDRYPRAAGDFIQRIYHLHIPFAENLGELGGPALFRGVAVEPEGILILGSWIIGQCTHESFFFVNLQAPFFLRKNSRRRGFSFATITGFTRNLQSWFIENSHRPEMGSRTISCRDKRGLCSPGNGSGQSTIYSLTINPNALMPIDNQNLWTPLFETVGL